MSMLQQVRGLRLVLKDELGAVMWGVGRSSDRGDHDHATIVFAAAPVRASRDRGIAGRGAQQRPGS
jgi:hypothetical protein